MIVPSIFAATMALLCIAMATHAIRREVPIAAGFWLVGAHIWTATLIILQGVAK